MVANVDLKLTIMRKHILMAVLRMPKYITITASNQMFRLNSIVNVFKHHHLHHLDK